MPMFAVVLAVALLTSCSSPGPPASPEPPPTQEPVWDLAPQFEFASSFSNGVALVQTAENAYEFIDYSGKNVFGKTFFGVNWFSDQKLFEEVYPTVWDQDGGPYYQIDRDGTALPAVEEEIAALERTTTNCLIATLENGREGLLDEKGQWLIPPEYDDVYLTDAVQVRVRQGERCGFLASDGSVVLAPEEVWSIEGFEEGYALARCPLGNNKVWYNFIDESGKLLLSSPFIQSIYERKPSLSVLDNRITYVKNGRYGFKDLTGKVVIPPTFADAGRFQEGLAVVENEKGKVGYIDVNGELCIPYRSAPFPHGSEFHNGLASYKGLNGKVGLIDKDGKWVVRPNYGFCYYEQASDVWRLNRCAPNDAIGPDDDIYFAKAGLFIKGLSIVDPICEDYVVGWQDERHILVSIDGTEAKWHSFDYVDSFSEGVARARENGSYGYIDTDGNWVFHPQFEHALPYSEGRAAVCLDGKWGYILPPTKN